MAGRGAQHHGLVRCGWRATTVDGPAAAKRRGGARPRYHASHGTNAHHRLEHDKITRGTVCAGPHCYTCSLGRRRIRLIAHRMSFRKGR